MDTDRQKTVRYVIVVHGMGDARKNETVLGVISRFADARSRRSWPSPPDIVTLGVACGQTGSGRPQEPPRDDSNNKSPSEALPWLEFDNIPSNPRYGPGPQDRPFLGSPSTHPDGSNIRFVDVHWKDVMSQELPFVGQSPGVWTDGLLGRLRRKSAYAETAGSNAGQVPQWALEILSVLGETINLVHGIMKLRAREVDDTVFGTYLGDVQLYGEYPYTRGRAVRRFHEIMAKVHWRHYEEEEKYKQLNPGKPAREPEYTIIAHSLGTVMAMDALLFAHSSWPVRTGQSEAYDRPYFAGYLTEKEKLYLKTHWRSKKYPKLFSLTPEYSFLDNRWLSRVRSFVTLGSPIDKFLIIWWLNYQHLRSTSWMDEALLEWRRKNCNKILHFNYVESQDPVGDNLDVARTAIAFDAVFKAAEDKVYVRYALPGLAHIHYWHDQALFDRIVDMAVDMLPEWQDAGTKWPPVDRKTAAPVAGMEPREPMWFCPEIFRRIVQIAYWIIPGTVIATETLLLSAAYSAEGWHTAAIAAIMFSVALLLGRYLISLSVWWRQVLYAKHPIEVSIILPNGLHKPIHRVIKSKVVYDPLTRRLTGFDLYGVIDSTQQNRIKQALLPSVRDRALLDKLMQRAQKYWHAMQIKPWRDLLWWATGLALYQQIYSPMPWTRNARQSGNEETWLRAWYESAFRGSLIFWQSLMVSASALLAACYIADWQQELRNHAVNLTILFLVLVCVVKIWKWRRGNSSARSTHAAGDADQKLYNSHQSLNSLFDLQSIGYWLVLILVIYLFRKIGIAHQSFSTIASTLKDKSNEFAQDVRLLFSSGSTVSRVAPSSASTIAFTRQQFALFLFMVFTISWSVINFTRRQLFTLRDLLKNDRLNIVNFQRYAATQQGAESITAADQPTDDTADEETPPTTAR